MTAEAAGRRGKECSAKDEERGEEGVGEQMESLGVCIKVKDSNPEFRSSLS